MLNIDALVWLSLFIWFNGISTLVGYLISGLLSLSLYIYIYVCVGGAVICKWIDLDNFVFKFV